MTPNISFDCPSYEILCFVLSSFFSKNEGASLLSHYCIYHHTNSDATEMMANLPSTTFIENTKFKKIQVSAIFAILNFLDSWWVE